MRLTLCAGMPRSGSTLLYQLVREVVGLRDPNLYSFIIGPGGPRDEELERCVAGLRHYRSVVVKLHKFEWRLLKFHPFIFTSYRDPRGIAASYKLMGWSMDRILADRALPRRMRHLRAWSEDPHHWGFRYEKFSANAEPAIRKIAEKLLVQITDDQIATIVERCSIRNHENWGEAGLNRVTGSNWRRDLSGEEQRRVIGIAKHFMEHYGYLKEVI